MPRPRISVIINNYNYASILPHAIASVLAQDARDVELVVVDDGSTDRSREVLQAYADRARVVLQDNAGQAAAINAGVRASRGEILCFLDADDWWSPRKISAITAAFDRHPRAGLVYHRLQPVSAEGVPVLRPIPRTLCNGDIASRLLRSGGWWPFPMTSAVSVRRSTWDEVGEIPEVFRISADAWLVGLQPFVAEVRALPDVLGYYRIHNNNWYRAADDPAMLRRRMAHWEMTVARTNSWLSNRGDKRQLQLPQHFPHAAAAARLEGADWTARTKLALHGLSWPGEPNLLRRGRDVLRLLAELRGGTLPEHGAMQDR